MTNDYESDIDEEWEDETHIPILMFMAIVGALTLTGFIIHYYDHIKAIAGVCLRDTDIRQKLTECGHQIVAKLLKK